MKTPTSPHPRPSPASVRPGVLACAGAILLAFPAAAQVPVLEPGTVHAFDPAPDLVTGSCEPPFLGSCDVVDGEAPLRAYAYGVVSRASASASVAEHHEFAIQAPTASGSPPNAVVPAQLAGRVRIRGFLFTMGGATATAAVSLRLVDLTGGLGDPRTVWSGPVADYRAETRPSFAVGAGVGVSVEGGFPYIGASGEGEIGLEMGISPDLQMIRDEIEFAFPVLLRRGGTYRLQLVLDVETRNRLLAATSIASFYPADLGGPAVPNVYNARGGSRAGTQNSWLSILTLPSGGKDAVFGGRTGNFGLPKGAADTTCGSVLGLSRNIWEQGLVNPFNQLDAGEAANEQRSDRFLSHLFGVAPGQAIGPQTLADSSFMRVGQDDEEEVIDLAGVELERLVLTLGEDPAETERRAANRAFERQLATGSPLVSSCLPRARGGDLEDILDLVDRLLSESTAAGLPVNNAAQLQSLARAEFAHGNYRQAYARTRSAYLQLTRDL